MSSVFSFTNPPANPAGNPPLEPAPRAALAAAPVAVAAANTSAPDQALNDLLTTLRVYTQGLAWATVSIVSVNEKSLGIGNWRGIEPLGAFGVLGLKGGHLDVVARFQFQDAQSNVVDDAVNLLQGRLLAAKDALWVAGVLRVAAQDLTAADFITPLNVWRRSADYKLLYEFRYQDADGAESLIARIPINVDPEQLNSPAREITTVTDDMVRWDNEAAPTLVVRGRLDVRRLSALAFVPGTPSNGSVTLKRTFDQATGPPTVFPTLAAFLAAVGGPQPTERHALVTFASLADFLSALGTANGTLTLGDWDGDSVPDVYEARTLEFQPVIQLAVLSDRFEVLCQRGVLNQVSVVYLRATA